MVPLRNRTQRGVKLVSATLVLSLLTTQVLFAHLPLTTVWEERRQAPSVPQLPALPKISDFQGISSSPAKSIAASKSLPLQFGTLRESFPGNDGVRLLLIQDIHLNNEAQGNVAKMLQQLTEQKNLGLVAVEGAEGAFDFEQFWKAADMETVQEVADTFFATSRLGAPSYVGITSGRTGIRYVGVDDYELYEANLNAYKTSERLQPALKAELVQQEKALEAEKEVVLNHNLRNFDRFMSQYHNGEISLGVYAEAIQNSTHTPLPNSLRIFLEAYNLEKKINWNRANTERKWVLEQLLAKMGPSQIDELVRVSLAYKSGEVRYGDFYRYLNRLLEKNSVAMTHAPAFQSYLRYTTMADGINAAELISDIRKVEIRAIQELCRTAQERELMQASRLLQLQERLVSFEMTPAEWGEYQSVIPANDELKPFEDFYRFADLRSEKIVKNFNSQRTAQGSKLSVLIVGGFHTPEITALLKKNGIGYAVVTPNITKVTSLSGSAYLSVFTREKTPLEKLFQGQKLTIYAAGTNGGNGGRFGGHAAPIDQATRVSSDLLQQLKDGKTIAETTDGGTRFQAIDPTAPEPANVEPIRGARDNFRSRPMQYVQDERSWSDYLREIVRVVWAWADSYSLGPWALGLSGDVGVRPYNGDLPERLKELANNFDFRFREPARALYKQLKDASIWPWGAAQVEAVRKLLAAAAAAFDWRKGWAANSKYYKDLKGHPIYLLTMEARTSAARTANDEAEFDEFMADKQNRLTTAQGGLGDLAGGWIAEALARMGMVTTMNPRSEAPEAYAFLPNYRQGVRLSKLDEYGWPIPDSEPGAWHSVRPQDFGIDYIMDPNDKSDNPQPLTVQVPVFGLGLVNVRFRAVDHGGLRVIMIETDDNDTPEKQGIFDKLYQGPPNSNIRFRQQWVYGLAVEEFKRAFKLPDGPIHMNETATFATLIGRLRTRIAVHLNAGVPLDEAYEIALEEVGNQMLFFTHTLEEVALDKFYDGDTEMGSYIREYMQGLSDIVPHLDRSAADNLASWLIQGDKKSNFHDRQLPGFRMRTAEHPNGFFSPLNFVVKLAYMVKQGRPKDEPVNVIAVSRINAKKAGEFFSKVLGVLDEAQVEERPVGALTNAVGELYFSSPYLREKLKLDAADPADRSPELILDPKDEASHKISKIVTHNDLPEDFTEAVISDADLAEHFDANHERMIWRVRRAAKEQYIRNIGSLVEQLKKGVEPEKQAQITGRLEELKRRWVAWTGEEFPVSLDAMKHQELKFLLDKDGFTLTWARRVVEYKRMLFTIFGEHFDPIEKEIKAIALRRDEQKKHGLPQEPIIIPDIIAKVMREQGVGSLQEMCAPILNVLRTTNAQFLFAGPTFDDKGRTQVAMLDYVIQQLSAAEPGLNVQNRILFVEGYNDELSPYLLQGSHVWLNTPKRPWEASGTSGMKTEGVNLTTPDGWAADGGFDGLNVLLVRPNDPLSKDHPDFWSPDQRGEEAEKKKYLRTEAASLYERITYAAHLYNQSDPHEWLALRRRSIYYHSKVFSVRSAYIGRHIPSADHTVSKPGPDPGMFDLYTRVIRGFESHKGRVENLKNITAAKQHVKFMTEPPFVDVGQIRSEAVARINVQIPNKLLPDMEFFVTWGEKDKEGWKTAQFDPASDMVVDSTSGLPADGEVQEFTLTKKVEVPDTVSQDTMYEFAVFATPKGAGGAQSHPEFRKWAGKFKQNGQLLLTPNGDLPDPATAGASGLWVHTDKETFGIGFWEGTALVVTASVVLSVISIFFGFSPVIPVEIHLLLTTLLLGGMGEMMVEMTHNQRFGVYMGHDTVSRDPEDIENARSIARLSFLGIPFIAAAFIFPEQGEIYLAVGFLLSTLPHAVTNWVLSKPGLYAEENMLASEIKKEAALHGQSPNLKILMDILVLQNRYQLTRYSTEVIELNKPENFTPARLFLAKSVVRNWRKFIFERLSVLLKPGDQVVLVPKGETVNGLAAEIRAVSQMIGPKGKITVILNNKTLSMEDSLRAVLGNSNLEFIAEDQLDSHENIEHLILIPAKSARKLKVVVNVDQVSSIKWIKQLVDLSNSWTYRNLVEYVLVTTLNPGAAAVLADRTDMNALVMFLHQA